MACSRQLSEEQILDSICDDSVLRDTAFKAPYTPLELGTRLRLERHEIDHCARPQETPYEQKYQILYYWKQSNGKKATYRLLLSSLDRCLPPNQLFIDEVWEMIRKAMGLHVEEEAAPEDLLESDAPGVSSTLLPSQQPLRTQSCDDAVNREMVKISNELLDISILQNRCLTNEMRKCIESNRQLRRANSMFMKGQVIYKAKWREERRRRSTVEGRLVSIAEERNKFMFENAALHARLGQLEQQPTSSPAAEDLTDTRTLNPIQNPGQTNNSHSEEAMHYYGQGNVQLPLAGRDYSSSTSLSPFQETRHYSLSPNHHNTNSQPSFSGCLYQQDGNPQATSLLHQSTQSAQSLFSSSTSLPNFPVASNINTLSNSNLSPAGNTAEVPSLEWAPDQSSYSGSSTQPYFVQDKVSFQISPLSPPHTESSLDAASLVEDSLVPEAVVSSVSAESDDHILSLSSCYNEATLPPEPAVFMDEDAQLEWAK